MKSRYICRRFFYVGVFALFLHACGGTVSPNKPFYEPDKASEINVKLGLEYLRIGRYEVAMNKLLRALEIDPRNAEGHNVIAVLYETLGENTKAHTHFRQAVALTPNHSSAHNNYGKFLCQQKQLAEAEEQFRLATANPLYESPEVAYTNAGICFMRERDLVKAEHYLNQALRVNRSFPVALYQMAKLAYEKTWYKEARSYLQRFVESAEHTPQSVMLGIQIARALPDRNMEASYMVLLKGKFGDSDEARTLLDSSH
jgi:type IV pilus assembly protein PilF